jgi:hypothetical protein
MYCVQIANVYTKMGKNTLYFIGFNLPFNVFWGVFTDGIIIYNVYIMSTFITSDKKKIIIFSRVMKHLKKFFS